MVVLRCRVEDFALQANGQTDLVVGLEFAGQVHYRQELVLVGHASICCRCARDCSRTAPGPHSQADHQIRLTR